MNRNNTKDTSQHVATLASNTLRDPQASATAKKLAGSALAQVAKGRETGKQMEEIASNALKSKKYSQETKTLAASVVTQSNKKR